MRLQRHVVYHIALIGLLIALGGSVIARARQGGQPSDGEVAFAREVSDLLVNELVAALFREFNEPSPRNAEHAKRAFSLIFNDLNRDTRLVGPCEPLGGANALP